MRSPMRSTRSLPQATNGKITKLIDDGVIRPETVLALVNALYLKASWLQTFEKALTADQTFTRLDGVEQKVPMMHGRVRFVGERRRVDRSDEELRRRAHCAVHPSR